MVFNKEVFDIMPPKNVRFSLLSVKIPNDKDIFFRAKQKETLDKFQAARRFMYELDTNDWNHYFHPSENENANKYFKNVLRAQLYEAALMFYNSVIDLSWVACYISAEYLIYQNGVPVEVEKITTIDEAYAILRKAEGLVKHPNADDSFTYLKKVCPEFTHIIDYIIEFWTTFSTTSIRTNYNYIKHKGALCYTEIQQFEPCRLFQFKINGADCPSDIRDIQKTICLDDSIECLRNFDNELLFPYIETLFKMLEEAVQPSPFIF